MNNNNASQELTTTSKSSASLQISSKKVSLHKRMFKMGNFVGVNAYRLSRAALKHHYAESGYQIAATPHFLVCSHPEAPTMVIHWFAPKAIDANLGHYFTEELKPFGFLEHPQSFGDVYGAVVMSLSPQKPYSAWHLFGINSLQRYHHLLTEPNSTPRCDLPIDVFTTLYKRVCELLVGESLLDAGCSFGLLPLVIAERVPSLTRVVGADIEIEPFITVRAIAEERHLESVQFVQADLLTDDIEKLGMFDTVTVLHVLEHFTEEEMYQVLKRLLHVTSQCLIIGVPYEPELENAYGHKQLFVPEKLKAVGQWCINQLGEGSMSIEDCVGGLLVVNRNQ